MLTRSWRFRTLTLDAYASSQPLKDFDRDSLQLKGEEAERKGDVAPLRVTKGHQMADSLTQGAMAQDDPGSDDSLSTSVPSSVPALRTADDGTVDTAAALDGPSDADTYVYSSLESARREQQERLIDSTATAAVVADHVMIPVKDPDDSSRCAASWSAVQSEAFSEGVTLSRGQLPHHAGSNPSIATSDAVVAAAVQPSQGFQTSTAVRDVHAGVVVGSIAEVPGYSSAGTDTTSPGSGAASGGSTAGFGPGPGPGPGGADLESVPGTARSGSGAVNRQEKAVVLREPARFAALKQKSLWRQLVSAEAIYLTLFFTANVLILQLYLGAHRML